MAILWRFLVAIFSNELGRAGVLAVLAFGGGELHAAARYEASEAAAAEKAQADHATELAREQEAARRIAGDALERAQRNEALAGELQGQIDDLRAKEAINVPTFNLPPLAAPPCAIDGAFLGRVRDFDAAARTPAPPRRSR
jgi:hypothetical protein